MLSDVELAPYKKMKEIRKWEKSWKTLSKVSSEGSVIQMSDTNEYLMKGGDMLFAGATSISSWTNLTNTIIEQFRNKFYSWKVRCLHNVGKRYLQTADHQLNGHASRVLGMEIDRVDVQAFINDMDAASRFKEETVILTIEEYEN